MIASSDPISPNEVWNYKTTKDPVTVLQTVNCYSLFCADFMPGELGYDRSGEGYLAESYIDEDETAVLYKMGKSFLGMASLGHFLQNYEKVN